MNYLINYEKKIVVSTILQELSNILHDVLKQRPVFVLGVFSQIFVFKGAEEWKESAWSRIDSRYLYSPYHDSIAVCFSVKKRIHSRSL